VADVRIIHRYVWREFILQFFICSFGFMVLGIGKIIFDYNDMFIGYRVTPQLMGYLVLNQLPLLMMDVLPAACLFGIILSLGRLLREREFEVFRICGASLVRTVSSIFIGITVFCVAAFFWNDRVVPAANHRFDKEVRRLEMQENLPLLKENVVIKAPGDRFIYLKKVSHKDGTIGGVLIIDAGQSDRQWPRIITAESGALKKGIWVLRNGVIHETDDSGAIISEVRYNEMEIKIANDFTGFLGDDKSPWAMTSRELRKYYEMSVQSGLNSTVYAVYFHQKFADPVISLVLAFVAVPLTIWTGRNSRWLGLVYCFLIIMAYYTMQVVGRTMGANGVLIPWLAAWAPHLVFLALGVFLMIGVEHRGGC